MATSITCSVCSKIYKSKQGYDRHLEFKRCKVKDCSVECSYCNKIFSNTYNKRVHEIKCLQLNNTRKIKALEEEIKMMRGTNPTQIAQTITNNNGTTNNNNNNGTINNNIIINSFGNEDTSHITNRQIIKALKMCKEFPLEMIKITHFDKDKPENHNIYKPNFKDKYVKYFNDNIWKIGDAKRIMTELYMSKMDIAEEKFDELKQYLSEITQGRFQWFLDNREEPEVMCEVLKKIAEMLYNERGLINE
jgi:hypothetical protein